MLIRKFAWLALILPLVSIAAEPPMSPANQLVELLQDIDSLAAKYEQTDQNTLQQGEFWLGKPDRFRLIAAAPISQVIVSDGENLWTHDLDLEQVIVTRLSDEADNIPLLIFTRQPEQLAEKYSIEGYTDEMQRHFVLSPFDTSGSIGKVAVSFDDGLPTRLVFETAMQQRTVIHFFEASADSIADDVFEFTIPEQVDVIDDRPGAD